MLLVDESFKAGLLWMPLDTCRARRWNEIMSCTLRQRIFRSLVKIKNLFPQIPSLQNAQSTSKVGDLSTPSISIYITYTYTSDLSPPLKKELNDNLDV